MNFNGYLIEGYYLALGQLIFWPCVAIALWKAIQQNIAVRSKKITYFFPILCFSILLAWQLEAALSIGVSIHLLGATLLTVLFGWSLAVVALTIVLISSVLIQGAHELAYWQAVGLNGLVMIVLPVLISDSVVRLVFAYLPRQFFVYIFLSGFANAMITLGAVGLVSTGVLLLGSSLNADALIDLYLPSYLLILFPEAFMTGMLLTMFVVYRPEWVFSFDDELYLKK